MTHSSEIPVFSDLGFSCVFPTDLARGQHTVLDSGGAAHLLPGGGVARRRHHHRVAPTGGAGGGAQGGNLLR